MMVAVLHAIRIVCGWQVMVGTLRISTGPSWLVAGFMVVLALIGLCLARKQDRDDPLLVVEELEEPEPEPEKTTF